MTSLPIMIFQGGTYQQREVVWFWSGDSELIDLLAAQLPLAKYAVEKKKWFFLKEDFNLNRCFNILRGKAYLDYSDLKSKKTPQQVHRHKVLDYSHRSTTLLPKGYREMLIQKRYSSHTIKTYCAYMKDFVFYFRNKTLEVLTTNDINSYILDLQEAFHISESQQNQRINAIKFYYEKVLKRDRTFYEIERPRKRNQLPKVLSKEEVKRIIDASENLKHKCIITLLYSTGIRRGELLNLKIEDINSDRMQIRIEGAKGNKDRFTLLSSHMLNLGIII